MPDVFTHITGAEGKSVEAPHTKKQSSPKTPKAPPLHSPVRCITTLRVTPTLIILQSNYQAFWNRLSFAAKPLPLRNRMQLHSVCCLFLC
jgi:hypothetical protein